MKRPRSHHDHSQPQPRVELEDTFDEIERTPVHDVADRFAAGVRSSLTSEEIVAHDRVIEAVAIEYAQQLAILRARELAAADGVPGRLVALEKRQADVAEWRAKLTGADDRNGRIGRLEGEVKTLLSGWKRILAALAAAGAIAGGGIYTVRDRYDAAQVARGRDDEWKRHVDRDLDRLFQFFNLPRSTP